VDPATAIRRAREQAKLSKRELARRAGTSPAAIVQYESATRDPSYSTLRRILRAAGFDAELHVVPGRHELRATRGRHLAEVLDLAEHLPRRRAGRRISYPPFAR